MRALVPCARGHARRRWRSGCEVGRDDLQVFSFALHSSVPMRNYSANFFTDHFAFADSMPHHARARPALARTCRRWRSGCGVGRDDLQVFSFALHHSVPMRNYWANFFHRSFCLCRFHATPCARSSHASARADMLPAARLTLSSCCWPHWPRRCFRRVRRELRQRRKHNPSPPARCCRRRLALRGRPRRRTRRRQRYHIDIIYDIWYHIWYQIWYVISHMISNMIRPICPVQATGSKRGQERDEANSTEDDLEVVKKTPATKRRCATKFRQI